MLRGWRTHRLMRWLKRQRLRIGEYIWAGKYVGRLRRGGAAIACCSIVSILVAILDHSRTFSGKPRCPASYTAASNPRSTLSKNL
jgi:hypothetical protein